MLLWLEICWVVSVEVVEGWHVVGAGVSNEALLTAGSFEGVRCSTASRGFCDGSILIKSAFRDHRQPLFVVDLSSWLILRDVKRGVVRAWRIELYNINKINTVAQNGTVYAVQARL